MLQWLADNMPNHWEALGIAGFFGSIARTNHDIRANPQRRIRGHIVMGLSNLIIGTVVAIFFGQVAVPLYEQVSGTQFGDGALAGSGFLCGVFGAAIIGGLIAFGDRKKRRFMEDSDG